ncbi:cell filamentation protein Fic [Planomonospora sphaerica]|uniref:Cell filamentation protein Fic n=1 Tax=Planomonospora sphaerica TaxID=161355 RepID=A0A171CPX5_9ACTN|nr:cell filamentation protein Fic [Planomonospora sphaerica]
MYELTPAILTWYDVDPQRSAFDPARARAVVAGRVPAASVPVRPADDRAVLNWKLAWGLPWTERMTRALVAYYGRWAVGWEWSGRDGGPVRSWCCVGHSITTPEQTLDRVADALVEWRSWLEELAVRFERFPIAEGRPEQERKLACERGTARLVTAVAERTYAYDDAWYDHCRQVLRWFLERWHVRKDQARRLTDDALGGRLESWSEPSPPLIEDVAVRLAGSLSDLTGR